LAGRTTVTQAGALDEDLKIACLAALECARQDCRDFAMGMTWTNSARIFIEHVAEAAKRKHHKPATIAA